MPGAGGRDGGARSVGRVRDGGGVWGVPTTFQQARTQEHDAQGSIITRGQIPHSDSTACKLLLLEALGICLENWTAKSKTRKTVKSSDDHIYKAY